ncbi:hypothetical protein QAD02_004932 [Eretmocerus hayati]|uniref:Uncharacterized protein n=1 Tax=Eretmocerus hayati TaxID=131215 RepID=A0ACC2NR39_9HYME|nr:hypothetical protein QAD02_004932 [Eretmocerus hayati]
MKKNLAESNITKNGRAESISSYLKICHRSDPNLNECIRQSVNEIKPYLSDGIPELDVPPCEPLHLSEIEISQATGPVAIRSIYHNIKIWGGTDFVLKSIKIDIDKDRIRLKLFIPRLEMQSEYKMDGKILMLPILGEGDAFGNFTDIDVMATIQGERYKNKNSGKLHFRVTEFLCDFELGYASIYLDNLFNGDEVLADAMNLFLNDNWRAVAEEMKPGLEVSMSKLFKNFSNKFYSKYPIDTLLPP